MGSIPAILWHSDNSTRFGITYQSWATEFESTKLGCFFLVFFFVVLVACRAVTHLPGIEYQRQTHKLWHSQKQLFCGLLKSQKVGGCGFVCPSARSRHPIWWNELLWPLEWILSRLGLCVPSQASDFDWSIWIRLPNYVGGSTRQNLPVCGFEFFRRHTWSLRAFHWRTFSLHLLRFLWPLPKLSVQNWSVSTLPTLVWLNRE